MDIRKDYEGDGWINTFAVSLAIWAGVIAGLSLL